MQSHSTRVKIIDPVHSFIIFVRSPPSLIRSTSVERAALLIAYHSEAPEYNKIHFSAEKLADLVSIEHRLCLLRLLLIWHGHDHHILVQDNLFDLVTFRKPCELAPRWQHKEFSSHLPESDGLCLRHVSLSFLSLRERLPTAIAAPEPIIDQWLLARRTI
jgi:hypothetical protein